MHDAGPRVWAESDIKLTAFRTAGAGRATIS